MRTANKCGGKRGIFQKYKSDTIKNPLLYRTILNNRYFCKVIEREMYKDFEIQGNVMFPTDPANSKGLNPYQGQGCDFKKCCKKYKKGDRCKKCPKR